MHRRCLKVWGKLIHFFGFIHLSTTLVIFHWFCQNSPMPRYQPDPRKYPAKPGGNGWLFSEQQQLVCQFRADNPSAHAEWVAVNTYCWIPPGPLIPQTRRRMLRHNAIEAWQTMLKTGWRRCPPPLLWIEIQVGLLGLSEHRPWLQVQWVPDFKSRLGIILTISEVNQSCFHG